MFKDFAMDAWRVWLRSGIVLTLMEYMPPPFDDLHYELYGKKLRGNVQKLPQTLLTLRVLQTFATQALSRVFVEHSVKESVKEDATTMVRRLKSATIHRVQKVSWMAEKTKQIAVEKIRAMRFQVAYPSVWYNEFGGLLMDPERLIHNILKLCARDTDRMLKTLGPGCGDTDGTWDDGAFDVNAYYYPDRNQLTIPAGMLRPPFFDQRRGAAWNYGGIGSAIGHEITHGFDADGKNFDLHGSFKDWWTAHDNEAYDTMTKDLIALYDGQEYAGGRVDGNLTLSENIADLGGVAIALDALHEYLREKKATASERKKAYKDFFLSYAVSWRNKDRPRKAKQSLYLDVHAPAPLRVNLVVRQFAEFYEAFDIGTDSPGWIAPEDRIQLW
jgi:putative endopeptidase